MVRLEPRKKEQEKQRGVRKVLSLHFENAMDRGAVNLKTNGEEEQ